MILPLDPITINRLPCRADVAEQWLAGIPAKTQHPWFRFRAEAAILEAKGDINGAMKKLDETETAILAFPRNAPRETACD